MYLPEGFLQRMYGILGPEFEQFFACYEKPAYKGIRVNTLKTKVADIKPFLDMNASPFSPLSFYVTEKVGNMPLHWAGAFYAQEPSASSAVTVLDPRPGDYVLDLCAAPGGKSTQIAALLKGKGLIWSNEVVRSRANILLSNMERMGVRNGVISSVFPDVLAQNLEGYFDKVLVDAPCSGEGMFRKNPEAIKEWSPEHVEACSVRQRSILDCAAQCVKEGGVLVYSTCTFSLQENEDTVEYFLQHHPEFRQETIDVGFGRPGTDGKSLRIFPMDGGEGHFVAKFTRIGQCVPYRSVRRHSVKKPNDTKGAHELYQELFQNDVFGEIIERNGKYFILPEAELPELRGILRTGVMLGELQGKRIEPHHALFMAHGASECRRYIDLANNSDEVYRYMRGEELDCSEKGYTAVCVEGIVLGFGKSSGGKLKNKYPKGLRFL